MALGAQSQQVVWTVAREVALLVGVGPDVGLALTLAAIVALRGVTVSTPGISLYRPAADPLALPAIAAFMAMVGLVAGYMPRATRCQDESARGASPRLTLDPRRAPASTIRLFRDPWKITTLINPG